MFRLISNCFDVIYNTHFVGGKQSYEECNQATFLQFLVIQKKLLKHFFYVTKKITFVASRNILINNMFYPETTEKVRKKT